MRKPNWTMANACLSIAFSFAVMVAVSKIWQKSNYLGRKDLDGRSQGLEMEWRSTHHPTTCGPGTYCTPLRTGGLFLLLP